MGQIPLVDLKAQYASIRDEIDAAIQRVLKHTGFILGEEVARFEKEFAKYCGVADAVGVASGTSALQLALIACGVKRGDEVITSSHTFMATAEAIVHAGATPVFVDIDPESYNLNPKLIESAVTSKTKAIVPVHLYGQPADMDPILEIAKKRGLAVVEDAAQAHGAEYKKRRCGGMGQLACFSFYPGKNLGAYGDAGAVTGNDKALLEKVRKLRDHGRLSKYEHDEIGFGERIDALQAAVLSAKLPHLEKWTEARRAIALRYNELLSGAKVRTPRESTGARHVYHLYVIRSAARDKLLEHLKVNGVGAGIHYPVPLHKQPAFKASHGSLRLPETERAAAEIVSLPIYPEMNEAQVREVARLIREFSS